jgi:hypothetical protein
VKPKQTVTTIRLDAATWHALRELAELRAVRLGGPPSQSAVVRELIRSAREVEADELRAAPERADS